MHINFPHKIFLLLVLATLIACNKENDNVVARVNNYSISSSELEYWMLLQRAEVYNYFYEKYGLIDNDDFWEQKIDDNTPLEMLKELALEKAVRCKVQQILALEKGLVDQIDFDRIISRMEDENKRRKEKIEKGGVIYGQQEYTKRTFFAHEFDKMILKLKPELLKSELKPSDRDLKAMATNKDFPLENNIGFYQMQYVEEVYERFIDSLVNVASIERNIHCLKQIDAHFRF